MMLRFARRSAWRSVCARAIFCRAPKPSSSSTTARCRGRCRARQPWTISPGICRMPNGVPSTWTPNIFLRGSRRPKRWLNFRKLPRWMRSRFRSSTASRRGMRGTAPSSEYRCWGCPDSPARPLTPQSRDSPSRDSIPVADTAAQFLAAAGTGVGRGTGAAAGAAAADLPSLKAWLKEQRGIPDSLLRFDLAAVPAHLMPQMAVTADGHEVAHGKTLADLRRASAAAARSELERRARAVYGLLGAWRRFEIDELPVTVPVALEQGTVWVFPALARDTHGLEVRYEWSAAEADRSWRRGAAHLARGMLPAQARDLAKSVAGNAPLLLAASPYLTSDALIETLLQWVFRRACFDDAEAPRARRAFEQAVDQGRARLHSCLQEIAAATLSWFNEARAVRRSLDAALTVLPAEAADESSEHLRGLLGAASLESLSTEWLRQLPR